MERVIGDPDAIAALKAMVTEHRDYLKFLLAEAQTNADHTATFTGSDGTRYSLQLDLATGQIKVTRVG
jgi:hypothetical protein